MKTMLDKCVAIGDVTKAHDVTGIETLGVIVAGLSSGTACKVVTCDTAYGVYTDFAELVPSTLASTSYNSGFVLPLTGAKKFVKVTGASLAVGFIGDCNYDINKAIYKDVSVSGIQKLYCFLSDGNYVVYTSKPLSELTTSDRALWVDNRDDANNYFLPITEVNKDDNYIRVDWTDVSDIDDNPLYWNGNIINFLNF